MFSPQDVYAAVSKHTHKRALYKSVTSLKNFHCVLQPLSVGRVKVACLCFWFISVKKILIFLSVSYGLDVCPSRMPVILWYKVELI